MNKLAALFTILLLCTLGFQAMPPQGVTAASEDRVIYVWWIGYEILEHQSERDNFFRIAQEEQITDIYIEVDEDTVNFFTYGYKGIPNAWATFISQSKSRGMDVHAILSGEAPDAFNNTYDQQQYIQKILKYNIENPTNKIVGINWDIEPLVTNHVALYTNLIRDMKTVSYSGQTIVSQGLVLSTYMVPPKWLNMRTGASFESIRTLYREFDLIDINSYQDTLANVIYQAADGPQVCQEEGIPFRLGLETGVRDYVPSTLFDDGKDAYHALQDQISGYFEPKFSMFVGQYTDHYQVSISRWYGITATSWPQGQFQPGQTVSVTTTVKRSDLYDPEAFGVKLRIRGPAGTIQEVSEITVTSGMETRQVTLQWTIPSSAANGDYDLEVSTWDIDIPWRGSTLLYSDFGGNVAALEALTMAELDAMTGLTGKRIPFVLVDNTGWKHDYISVNSTTPPPTTPVPVLIDIGSEPGDFNRHFGAGHTLIENNNPANASGTIDTIELWAYSNLTGVKVGAFYPTSNGMFSARGDPAFIGNVTAGSKQTFTGLSLSVEQGDYIGIYMASGDIEYYTDGGGMWTAAGDNTSAQNVTYTSTGFRTVAIQGYGTSLPPTTPPPAGDVDVGSGAQDYNNHWGAGYTLIDMNNPANASGTIDTIELWAYSNLTGVKVGVFYVVNGSILSSRGSPVSIGNVAAGSMQTFTGLSLSVEQGDYIGIYTTSGDIEYAVGSGAGIWYKSGDNTSVQNSSFTAIGSRHIAIGGYSAGSSDIDADINGDGTVNILDQILIGQHMGQSGVPGWIPEDLNRDGNINVLDMIIVGQNWSP